MSRSRARKRKPAGVDQGLSRAVLPDYIVLEWILRERRGECPTPPVNPTTRDRILAVYSRSGGGGSPEPAPSTVVNRSRT